MICISCSCVTIVRVFKIQCFNKNLDVLLFGTLRGVISCLKNIANYLLKLLGYKYIKIALIMG